MRDLRDQYRRSNFIAIAASKSFVHSLVETALLFPHLEFRDETSDAGTDGGVRAMGRILSLLPASEAIIRSTEKWIDDQRCSRRCIRER
jgi:hypothetical protein